MLEFPSITLSKKNIFLKLRVKRWSRTHTAPGTCVVGSQVCINA